MDKQHIENDSDGTKTPLEAVKQMQREREQGLREKSHQTEDLSGDITPEVPGQGPPPDIRHHPQRDQRGNS